MIIDNRLFITNVGTSHCFVCKYEKNKNEKIVVSCCTEHKLSNVDEMRRLIKLNANIETNSCSLKLENPLSNYTRCLGDFNFKRFYRDYPELKYSLFRFL